MMKAITWTVTRPDTSAPPTAAPPGDARLDRVVRLAAQAEEAAQVRALTTHPDMIALRVERVRGQVDALLWAGIVLGLAFTMVNVQTFAATGNPAGSLAWWVAWLLDPMVSLVLLAVLRAEQVTARYQVALPVWARRTKWLTFAATYVMNTWTSWGLDGHPLSWSGVVLHSVPPLVVFATAETGPGLRDRLTESVHRALAEHAAGSTGPAAPPVESAHEQVTDPVREPLMAPVREPVPRPARRRPTPRGRKAGAGPRRLLADYLATARAALDDATTGAAPPVVTPAWVRLVTGCSAGTSLKVAAALRGRGPPIHHLEHDRPRGRGRLMSTTTVGTPDPDNHERRDHDTARPRDPQGDHVTTPIDRPDHGPGDSRDSGRVIDFPTHTIPTPGPPPVSPSPAPRPDPVPPLPAVVDGEVISSTDLDDDGAPRVPVDPAATTAGREVLPWQRREVERRPVIAPWLTRADDLRAALRWAAGWVWHATGFHTVRAPLYAVKLTWRAPRGVLVAASRAAAWVGDAESRPLRDTAIRGGESDQYLRLTAARADRVRVRRRLAFAGVLASGAALIVVQAFAPPWMVLLLAMAGVLVLGLIGSPADRPVTGRSVVRTEVQRLTSDIVIRALGALGLAEINKAMTRGPGGITFPAPITRDGPGWRADVDLPYGVTVTDIVERRDRLASGLRRPLGCVWPEPASEAHAGRLVLWVGDQDMSQAKPAPWPLAKGGSTDLFRPIPFGVDQRGRRVEILLMFANVLIGAMPRFGKTFALRVLVLAAALDPTVQLRIFELKGTGDLSTAEPCAHHYGSGADDATLEAGMDSLRDLYAELDKRAATIRGLPRELCPENKVTPELSARRALGLFPIVMAIDECQELFSHPDFRDEADRLATGIIKRGPALGIILVLATQRPDAKSLPTGVSANVGIRFCLRVMGQTENDMVLGTSAYKNGLRATTFGPRDKGIGYLVGAGDEPQIARSAYIDGPAAEAIAARARALREVAGTITGHAAGDATGQPTDRPRRSILGDIATVFGPDEDRLWSETIAARLAEQWPTTYQGTTPASLAATLKPYGLAPAQVWGTDPDTRENRNRRGYLRDAVTTAWLATRKDRPGPGDGPAGGDSA